MRHEVGRAGWTVAAALASAIVVAPGMVLAQDVTLRGTTISLTDFMAHTRMAFVDKGRETPTTLYISQMATRSSMGEGMDVIIRLDTKKMFIIDNKKKTYSERTFDEMENMAAGAGKENPPPEAAAQMKPMMGSGEVTVTPLGPGETIAGYATEKYHVTKGGEMEVDVWMAPALVMPAAYYDAMKSLMPANPMFDEYKKIGTMQLKSVSTMKVAGHLITTTAVVKSVDKAPIPAATFDVPAGYKAVPMK
jgi:Domain of unknown function (DUF4412)